MKEAITEILRAGAENGEVRRRDVASFTLLLIAPLIAVAGVAAGSGAVLQATTLAACLALVVSLRLVVKPSGGARAVYMVGAVAAAITFAGGAFAPLNAGVLALEPACAALLVTAGALFAARGQQPSVPTATAYSEG